MLTAIAQRTFYALCAFVSCNTALTTKPVLNASAFVIGTATTTAAQRIIYNSSTGVLTYDSNGSAAGGATVFAQLSTGLALTASMFNVT